MTKCGVISGVYGHDYDTKTLVEEMFVNVDGADCRSVCPLPHARLNNFLAGSSLPSLDLVQLVFGSVVGGSRENRLGDASGT